MKMNLICWSGGYDSTAVILHAIKHGIDFETVYFRLNNNVNKSNVELYCRDKMIDVFKKHGIVFDDYIIDIGLVYFGTSRKLLILPYLWNFGLTQFLSQVTKPYDSIQMGYIRNDDFWHVYKFTQANLETSLKMISNDMLVPQFEYPLQWLSKEEVLETFNSTVLAEDLKSHIWTCETPIVSSNVDLSTYTRCGKCNSCKHLPKHVPPTLRPVCIKRDIRDKCCRPNKRE